MRRPGKKTHAGHSARVQIRIRNHYMPDFLTGSCPQHPFCRKGPGCCHDSPLLQTGHGTFIVPYLLLPRSSYLSPVSGCKRVSGSFPLLNVPSACFWFFTLDSLWPPFCWPPVCRLLLLAVSCSSSAILIRHEMDARKFPGKLTYQTRRVVCFLCHEREII